MNTKHFIVMGALLSIAACTYKKIETDVPFPTEELTFDASFGDVQNTKTVIKNETEVWWSPNDAISVFYGNLTSGKFTSSISEAAATSKFTGSLSAVTGTIETGNKSHSFWAVYPYDVQNSCDGNSVTLTVAAKQKGADGTFARKSFPAIATSTGLDLAFYNVCGGMVITVTRDDIRSITLKGNNNETLAGAVRVAFVNETPSVLNVAKGEQSIVLKSPDNKPFVSGTKYFITVLPVDFSQGFSLTLSTEAGEEGVKEITEAKTINRSRFLIINNADEGVTFAPTGNNTKNIRFVDSDLKDKLVASFDKDKDGELSYDEAAAVKSAQDIITAIGGEKSYQSFDEFQYFTGITSIPESMFKDWNKMKSIILPESVTSIGASAFSGCASIVSLVLPNEVTSIGHSAFEQCIKLENIIIPDGITYILSNTFYYCTSLKSITIPNTVKEIGRSAFYDSGLQSIIIPGGVSKIGDLAFDSCDNLAYVMINEGVSSVGSHAFAYCSSLLSIEFPSTIKSIGEGVCANSNLVQVTIKAVDVPTSGGIQMFLSYRGYPIYVPSESVEDYKNAVFWSEYADRITAILENGDDSSVSNNVSVSYHGGSIVEINGLIQQNSKLNYYIFNNSSKQIKVLTIQLVDGLTGLPGNFMQVNTTVEAGTNTGWTITIGANGIHSPSAIFVYSCEGKRYEVSVPFSSN